MQLFGRYILTTLLLAVKLVFALSNKKLSQLSAKHGGIIPLTNSNYQKILSAPIDSYMVVLLTATNPHVNCMLCKELEPEYQLLAESWFKDHPDGLEGETKERGLFFAKADFIDPNSNEIFIHYQITNVPRLFLFRPGGSLDTFDSLGVPAKAGVDRVLALIEGLKAETGITNYRIHQAFNWGSFFISVGVTMVTVAILKRYSSIVWSIASYKPVWGLACVSFIITLITGTMFNKIRETPYVGVSKDGNEPIYFAMRQQQFQFGVETQILSFIYGILVVGFILLTLMVPKISDYYRKNNRAACTTICLVASLGFSFVIFISFSALIAVFKLKNGEYPFKLFSLT